MRDLLSPRHRSTLLALASERSVLAFDFDGTLAPIVPRRHVAVMAPSTARLFAQLCERFPVAIISGRSRADLVGRLGHARVRHLIGNHGAESTRRSKPSSSLERARQRLATTLARFPGVELEDKRFSLSVHVRHSTCAHAVVETEVRRAARGLRVVMGKDVMNLLPREAPDKGDALLAVCRHERASAALFIGDDVTDEDAFALADPSLVTVRVGRSATSRARYFIDDQRGVDGLLHWLVTFRQGP
jgi:trehalose 6-phosphate phosphatase